MIVSSLTKDFGVIASDSASYKKGEVSFDKRKLFQVGNTLMTFIGASLYLDGLRDEWFKAPMDLMAQTVSTHIKNQDKVVRDRVKEFLNEDDDQDPNLCMYVLGIKDKLITLVEINSYSDFKPKFTQATDKVQFAGILYGDDSHPEKQKIFKQSKEYMENIAKNYTLLSPGILGEILTRGIYNKADLEEAEFKKYAGGVVSVGAIKSDGTILTLSNIHGSNSNGGNHGSC